MKKITIASMVFGLVLGSLFSIGIVSRAAVVTVSAGSAQSITLPTSTVTLTGTATATSPATIASYAWTEVSGPSSATLATPTTASTVVTGLNTTGTYVFKLTAVDSTSLIGAATVTITVNAAPLVTVSAGSAQSITLPTSTVTLTGTATATSPATIASYAWTEVSGPSSATLATPTTASTVVTGLNTTGTYVFKLTATDNSTPTAKVGSATVSVVVNPAVITLPPFKNIKSKLEINSNGKINLQGELVSVGTGIFTVKVWGITFIVNTANTNWNGKVSSVTDYKVGDIVSVNGQLDKNASSPTVIARNVKNMTSQVRNEQEKKALKELNKEKEKKEKEDKKDKHED